MQNNPAKCNKMLQMMQNLAKCSTNVVDDTEPGHKCNKNAVDDAEPAWPQM